MSPRKADLVKFKKEIWRYYRKNRRDFPWRGPSDSGEKFAITPYKIVVSEIMLQQTQAPRVVPRFERFIKRFPNWKYLARATTPEVLHEWQGLGYNRRALYLKHIAETVTQPPASARFHRPYSAEIPQTYDELRELPGIGPNTAGSILAFAWNIPYPFIETNIRSVFIHFFFKNRRTKITDKEILKLIETTLDLRQPREWYYALMDYGAYLKAGGDGATRNPSHKSAHHVKQSAFRGSNRELRSLILKEILKKPQNLKSLNSTLSVVRKSNIEDIERNIKALEKEGFIISIKNDLYKISK